MRGEADRRGVTFTVVGETSHAEDDDHHQHHKTDPENRDVTSDQIHIRLLAPRTFIKYRDRLKGLYVVARNFFLLLLNFSAWPCLAVA